MDMQLHERSKVVAHQLVARLHAYAGIMSFSFLCKWRFQFQEHFVANFASIYRFWSAVMTSLVKTLFFACFGCARLRQPNKPRLLLTRETKESDRRAVWTTGLTFQLELLGSQQVKDDHEIKEVEEAASHIISEVIELHTQPKTVELTIAPTRLHVVECEPWAILYDHPVATITNVFAPVYDRRLIMYSVTNPDDKSIQLFCFRTGVETTGLQVFRAMEYSLWCWKDHMCCKLPDNRVAELRKAYAAKMQCTNDEVHQPNDLPTQVEPFSEEAAVEIDAGTEESEKTVIDNMKADKTEPSTPVDDSVVPADCDSATPADRESVIENQGGAFPADSKSVIDDQDCATPADSKSVVDNQGSATPADSESVIDAYSVPSFLILSTQLDESHSAVVSTSSLREMDSCHQTEGSSVAADHEDGSSTFITQDSEKQAGEAEPSSTRVDGRTVVSAESDRTFPAMANSESVVDAHSVPSFLILLTQLDESSTAEMGSREQTAGVPTDAKDSTSNPNKEELSQPTKPITPATKVAKSELRTYKQMWKKLIVRFSMS